MPIDEPAPPVSNTVGRLLVIAAAVLWSSSGFFAKAPTFSSWPIESRGILFAFWRALFAALILVLFVRKIRWTWRLLPLMVVFVLMNWTYLSGMVYCESSLAIWLQYTAPAWVFLGAWALWKEIPKHNDWLMLGFAAIGVAIILSAKMSGASSIGVWYGLASGVFFASVVLCLRSLRDLDSAWLIFLAHAVTAAALAPFAVGGETWPQGKQWLYLALFGSVQMGIPYVLFSQALKRISSHQASGLTLLEPVLVPLWVWLAWRQAPDYEYPAVTTVMGAALILAGLLVSYRKTK